MASHAAKDTLGLGGINMASVLRHGCNVAETAEHILVHCPFYNKERKLLTTLCNSLGLEVSMVTFLTDKRLQTRVERLIGRFLKTKDD